MKIIDGGVTAAKGFKAAGMHAGIKKGTKKDMAMIVSSAAYYQAVLLCCPYK